MADLTYVATQEGWLYLAGIKDVYTCEIVGYAMGERMTKELTGKDLFMALRSQRPPAGLIHHSDRGSQYCAYDYRVIQEQFGLKTSMSRKGNCYDNAPMESFWGTLKNESLSHYRFNNRDEAISVIREYIEIFYNRQRRRKRTARAVLTGMCYSAGSAMRHGSSSLTRLTGQSAMTPGTWRR